MGDYGFPHTDSRGLLALRDTLLASSGVASQKNFEKPSSKNKNKHAFTILRDRLAKEGHSSEKLRHVLGFSS